MRRGKRERRLSIRESSALLILATLAVVTQLLLFINSPIKRVGEVLPSEGVIVVKEGEESEKPHGAGEDKSGEKREENEKQNPVTYFKFDPNSVSKEELIKLGLSSREAEGVLNYRAAGGRFYSAEEFAKIYTLPSGFYQKVKPYIEIKFDPIELNSADSATLTQIRGIGPYYAHSIVALRERCWGIATPWQLTKISGFDSSKVEELLPFISIDTTKIVKREINSLTYHQLSEHPFIGAYLARAIIRERERAGAASLSLATLIIKGIVSVELGQLLQFFIY